MKTKTAIVEKPYCTPIDYKFELEKFCHKFEVINLAEKKRAIFEHKLDVYGYYRGAQVELVCNEDGIDVRPVTPHIPLLFVHHPQCGCSLIK